MDLTENMRKSAKKGDTMCIEEAQAKCPQGIHLLLRNASSNMPDEVVVEGRLNDIIKMGKAMYATVTVPEDKYLAYVNRDIVGLEAYEEFSRLHEGDIVRLAGAIYQTNKEPGKGIRARMIFKGGINERQSDTNRH